ncbi:MAG: chromate transporter [Fusobacteriaceae bacterium]
MIYLQIFYEFFKIGLFSFGGGYVMLTMIYSTVVEKHSWLTSGEFTDIVAISQITPGPIAVNTATYIGYKVTGTVFGSAFATLGVILPAVMVMGILIVFIFKNRDSKYVEWALKGVRPVAVGLVLSAAVSLMTREIFIDYKSYIIFFATLIGGLYFKIGIITMILLSALAGVIVY